MKKCLICPDCRKQELIIKDNDYYCKKCKEYYSKRYIEKNKNTD